MSSTIADELDRLDGAFSGNRLLATFPKDARAIIEPAATIVDLSPQEVILEPGDPVQHSYFPLLGTTVSLLVCSGNGQSVEVASIGREGAVGGIVSCGHAPAFAQAQVQVPGPTFRVTLAALEEAKRESPFIGNLFCRYADLLLAQVMQSVACNAFHSIEERAARWLLTAQDRAGDRVDLTQEALAGLLGAQRTSVNAAVRSLQEQGLIVIRRGSLRVIDRSGLKRLTCACYDSLERHFSSVIGPGGTGRR